MWQEEIPGLCLRTSRNDERGKSAEQMMRITILFGGTNKERLVSVASAQALHQALPEADLWFWDVDDTVHEVRSRSAARPFPAVRGSIQAGQARHRHHRDGARQGQGRGSRAGARPAWRQGGERRVAGDVRNARHPLHRVRLGFVASRLRQGRGQTLCRHCGREGAGRRRAGEISMRRLPNTASSLQNRRGTDRAMA